MSDCPKKFDGEGGSSHGLEARATGAGGPLPPLPHTPSPNPVIREHGLYACVAQARCLCSRVRAGKMALGGVGEPLHPQPFPQKEFSYIMSEPQAHGHLSVKQLPYPDQRSQGVMICLARLMGMAKPMPWPEDRIMLLMPTTLPLRSRSGPPLLPGLMEASVWM
jgi:hypothetical protein